MAGMIQQQSLALPVSEVDTTTTFDGTTGGGEFGTAVAVCTVTGTVVIEEITFECTTNIASTTGTLSAGVVGSVDLFVGVTTASDIDATEFWSTSTPAAPPALIPAALRGAVVDANIIFDPLTANITGGVIRTKVRWRPYSAGATLVAA